MRFGALPAPISYWDDSTIQGTVPGRCSSGTVSVVIEHDLGKGLIVSTTQEFRVVNPSIATMTAIPGAENLAFTISGSGFGAYAGDSTRVMIGSTSAALAVWADTEIVWNFPHELLRESLSAAVTLLPADGGAFVSPPIAFQQRPASEPSRFAAPTLSSHPDSAFYGEMNIPAARGGRIETPSGAAVTIPARALTKDFVITIRRATYSADNARRRHLRSIGEAISFGREDLHVARPLTVEVPYDASLADPARSSDISLYSHDQVGKSWAHIPSRVDTLRHVLVAEIDHFSVLQPLGLGIGVAAADASFGLKAAYAFPNPVRGGQSITFRVQPGLADSIRLNVYDLAGHKIYSASNFVQNQIDDGNGLGVQYTYDHPWNVGGIGSGVYTYAITVQKAGEAELHKTGRVGVVK